MKNKHRYKKQINIHYYNNSKCILTSKLQLTSTGKFSVLSLIVVDALLCRGTNEIVNKE